MPNAECRIKRANDISDIFQHEKSVYSIFFSHKATTDGLYAVKSYVITVIFNNVVFHFLHWLQCFCFSLADALKRIHSKTIRKYLLKKLIFSFVSIERTESVRQTKKPAILCVNSKIIIFLIPSKSLLILYHEIL